MVDLVWESVRIERALSRPPFIRCNGKAALDAEWPTGPFADADGWRQKLVGHPYNVGLVMGRGLLAVDVDTYKPAAEDAWDALREDTGLDDNTVRQLTGRGGLHAFYRYPSDVHVPSVPLGPRGYPGIEIKADGGYVVVAPSVHPDTGRPYSWEDGWGPDEIELLDAPASLLELIGAGTTPARGHWRPLAGGVLGGGDHGDLRRSPSKMIACDRLPGDAESGDPRGPDPLDTSAGAGVPSNSEHDLAGSCSNGGAASEDPAGSSLYLDDRDLETAGLLVEHFGGHDVAVFAGRTIGVWRPGKLDGSASVTIGYIGPGVAKVWSDGWPPFTQGQVVDAAQLRAMAGIVPTVDVPAIELPAGHRLWMPGDDVVPDPVLGRPAYIGPLGDYLDLLAGNTEAHPAAVGIQVLASLGTIIGRKANYRAGRIVHHANLFAAVVGPSSEGAKGVADAEALALLDSLSSSSFLARHSIGGLGSGEALVRELADDQDPPAEKRRIVFDAELSGVLKVVKREGSILGDVIRKAFDYAPLRHSTVGNKWVVASGHHIAIVGSITPEELRAHVDGIAIANGFANRFLFVWSRLTAWLPEGGTVDPVAVAAIADRIGTAFAALEKRTALNGTVNLPLDPLARERWSTFYRARRVGVGAGITKALTSRQVAHAARIALIYAVLDGSAVIAGRHIDAGAAWCDYSTSSAAKAFAGQVAGKAGVLLQAIRDAGGDGLDGTAQHAVFQRNLKAADLAALRDQLEADHLIATMAVGTEGRPRLLSFALASIGATP